MKIYDARSGGGFPAERAAGRVRAADECHGAGSDRRRCRRTAPARRSARRCKGQPEAEKHKKHKKHKRQQQEASRTQTKADMRVEPRTPQRTALRLTGAGPGVLRGARRDGAPPTPGRGPVKEYSTIPTTTQAGGHPDVNLEFQSGKPESIRYPELSCYGNASRTRLRIPGRLHRRPARDAALHDGPVRDRNARSTPRSGLGPVSSRRLAAARKCGGELFFRRPLYNMVPNRVRQDCWLHGVLLDFPIYTVLSARTGSDYGLDARQRDHHSSPCASRAGHSGACRRRRSTTLNRFNAAAGSRSRKTTRPVEQPGKALPVEPDHLRGPLDATFKTSPTTASEETTHPGRRRPAATS